MSEYILEVGKKGFDRLKFINDIFGSYSEDILQRSGLSEDLKILEVGCGTGSMTIWLAKKVGVNGKVIAIDASQQQIQIAKAAAKNEGLNNIEFICSTIEELNLPNDSVDLAYSRLLLMHLNNPRYVLEKLKKYLKLGGVIVCDEPHASSLTTTPCNESIEKLNELFIQLGKFQGFDFDIGDKLFSMLNDLGFSNVQGRFIQPVIPIYQAVDFVLMGISEVLPMALKAEVITEAEANKITYELQNIQCDKSALYTFPRQAQIFGYKY